MSTSWLSIYYPLTPFLGYTNTLCFGVIEQIKLNPLTYANFNFTIFSALISSKRTWKGPKWIFSFIRLTILFSRQINLHTYTPSLMNTCFCSPIFFLFVYVSVLIIPFVLSSSVFLLFFTSNIILITHSPSILFHLRTYL